MGKRIFDLAGAVILLLLVLPILSMSMLAIWLRLGRPVLFRQARSGLRGRPFTIWKLRTIMEERDASGNLRPAPERLVRLGQFLRASSIDELPQLWNVICGDMSLVGPRPLLPKYFPLYSARQARRHEVKPGLTGWAQVQGRNTLDWEHRLEFDVWYVENRSFALDLRILLLTLATVVRRRDMASASGRGIEEFQGTRPAP